MHEKDNNNIKIGVVILNYNTYDDTLNCVKSIKMNNSLKTSIYIVDNNSADGSGEKLTQYYRNSEDIHVINNTENRGYSAGNNIGIRAAERDGCNYIAIVNSDVELVNDAFRIMVGRLLDNDDVMMIGPSVIDINGNESQLPKKKLDYNLFLFGRHPFCDIPYLNKKGDRVYRTYGRDYITIDGSVSGCCFVISTKDFSRISYLDENEFLYYEEDTLAYKMEKLGMKAAVDYEAKVIHKAGVSTSKHGNAFIQFHRWTSVLYMLKTYAQIGYSKQLFIALWNIITWDLLSLVSEQHRKLRHDFRKKNWAIIKIKTL